jgi:hypothetical protein
MFACHILCYHYLQQITVYFFFFSKKKVGWFYIFELINKAVTSQMQLVILFIIIDRTYCIVINVLHGIWCLIVVLKVSHAHNTWPRNFWNNRCYHDTIVDYVIVSGNYWSKTWRYHSVKLQQVLPQNIIAMCQTRCYTYIIV